MAYSSVLLMVRLAVLAGVIGVGMIFPSRVQAGSSKVSKADMVELIQFIKDNACNIQKTEKDGEACTQYSLLLYQPQKNRKQFMMLFECRSGNELTWNHRRDGEMMFFSDFKADGDVDLSYAEKEKSAGQVVDGSCYSEFYKAIVDMVLMHKESIALINKEFRN